MTHKQFCLKTSTLAQFGHLQHQRRFSIRFAVAFVVTWQCVAALHSQLHFSRHSGHAVARCDVTCLQITGYSDPVLKQLSLEGVQLCLIVFINLLEPEFYI